VAAAHQRGHLATGYRVTGARSKHVSTAIHLDPPKSRVVDLKPNDRLIVVVGLDLASPMVGGRRTTGVGVV
jgi:hypothetical protein